MVETIQISENNPFPNNELLVLHYPGAVRLLLENGDAEKKVLAFFEENGYTNGWVNGIHSFHHFHANTHEVLACVAGEATVQLGGPGSGVYRFVKGDVLLLPAGTSHKRIDATTDFQIVGAYPDGLEPDMQRGNAENYEEIKAKVENVAVPKTDPVNGTRGGVLEYWQ